MVNTRYRLSNRESALTKSDLLEKLAPLGVFEKTDPARPVRIATDPVEGKDISEEYGTTWFTLSDGQNFLTAYISEDGLVSGFCAYGTNKVEKIIEAIETACEEVVISEHDDGFFDEEDG